MTKIIRDIWIINEEGAVLFNHTYDEKMKPKLYAAIMSALDSFAKELNQGGLSNFQLSNKRFSVVKRNKLIFIANSDPKKIKERKALNELESIANKFFEVYDDQSLDTWDGAEDTFKNFINNIDESVEEKVYGFLENI